MTTLTRLQSKLAKLQQQADELLRKKAAAALAEIHRLMAEHGLTAADIGHGYAGAAKGRKRGGPEGSMTTTASATKKAALKGQGKLPPKYRNPATGATWSGHARPPGWIKDVKDRRKFLIAGAADVAAGSDADKKAGGKSVARKVAARSAVEKKAVGGRTSAKKVATKKAAAKKPGTRKAAAKGTMTDL